MPTTFTNFYYEEIAGFAHALKSWVQVEDAGSAVLASADLSAVADDENAVDDGVVKNTAGISIPPSANGTAAFVRWYTSDPSVTGVLVATDPAADVIVNLTVQIGTNVDIAVNAMTTNITGA